MRSVQEGSAPLEEALLALLALEPLEDALDAELVLELLVDDPMSPELDPIVSPEEEDAEVEVLPLDSPELEA
jgi:hypothetical protein